MKPSPAQIVPITQLEEMVKPRLAAVDRNVFRVLIGDIASIPSLSAEERDFEQVAVDFVNTHADQQRH